MSLEKRFTKRARATTFPNGLRPSRAQGVSPGFRASLVQPFALPLRCRVGDPPPLALCYPRVRHVAFRIFMKMQTPPQSNTTAIITFAVDKPKPV